MSDLVTLKVGDIAYSVNPKIKEKKTGKTRVLFLQKLQKEIQEYTENKNPDDWLFPSRQGNNEPINVNMVYQLYQKCPII